MADKRKPHCGRCDSEHYNFAPCNPRQDVKPPIQWRGGEMWGDQLRELKHLGGNTFVQRREWDK